VHGNIRHGFVYERVPHITLKSIANNAEIDVIWEQWQAKLDPARGAECRAQQDLAGVGDPARRRPSWPDAAKKLHADWWQARIARQKEIDASIAAKAEFETLYDKPYETRSACASPAPSPSRASRRTGCSASMRTTS
jgi:adenine-specific DNA-methyltransferase